MVRREGFEPPAFWSVGCLKGKSESFRLRFVLFAAIRSADFPLFPSSPARFFRILGQNWVKGEKRNWMLIRDSVFHLMRLVCVTPFEEQATKWTPQLRDRYFDMLADCTDLSCVDYQETPNAQLMAYRRIVRQSDMLVAVYDPELASGSAEDKAMAYALALGKPTLLIHPNTWKKKWLNVVKREGE